jgi:glycerol transport system permease protein
MEKWEDNRAWFLVLPVFVIVAFSAIIPLMTVVNYSLQDIFGPCQAVFVGTEWFKQMLSDTRLHDALWRQFLFSGLVLLIEIPLGILIALAMPKKGWTVSASLVTLAIPLLIPWNVIGTIWIIFTRPDIGLFGVGINSLGILDVPFDHTPIDLLDHPDGHGGLALDPAGGSALLRRIAGDSRSILPGRPHRRRLGVGCFSLHPTA